MTSSIPETMRALVIEQRQQGVIQYDRPVPKIADDEILVKVSYVALVRVTGLNRLVVTGAKTVGGRAYASLTVQNPTDFKHLDDIGNPNSTSGCDYSGTVVSFGSKVTRFQKGDRVFGIVHGGKFPEIGSFAEYVKVKGDMAMRAPDQMKDEELATYGVGFLTAAMVLFHQQKNPYPPAQPKTDGWFLVSGGSTSVGLYTLSLLSQLGIPAIATASPKNHELVKSYGATHVVNYSDPDAAVKEIKALTGGGVSQALECVGGEGNFKLSTGSFKEGGGMLSTLTIIPESAYKMREDVKIDRLLLYTVGGYTFEFYPGRYTVQAKPDDHTWYVDFVKRAEGNDGFASRTKPNPITLGPGGLDGVLDGLDILRNGRISASKLVYRIATK